MTVGELERALRRFPATMTVAVEGYESGLSDVSVVRLMIVTPRPDPEEWNGRWDYVVAPGEPTTSLVLIGSGRLPA